MNKFYLAGAAGIALLASGIAVAAGQGGFKMDTDGNGEVTRAEAIASSKTAFTRMDGNKDGVLNETDKSARKANRFANMDGNKDGQLTKVEMQAAHAARMADRAERGGKHMDKLTDAQKAEWQAKAAERHAARFAAMDTDTSGTVSAAEFEAGHAAMRDGGMMHDGEGRRGHGGKHGGGHGRHHGGMGGHGADMMEMADTNGDKAISQEEFQTAALARFDRADTDKNGVISTAEHDAMKQDRREKRAKTPAKPVAPPVAPAPALAE